MADDPSTPNPAPQKGKKKRSARSPSAHADPDWIQLEEGTPDPRSDAFAYQVALHAWRDGLTANSIVKALGFESSPDRIMQVKRALKRAYSRFLKIELPELTSIQNELNDRINGSGRRAKPIAFHVVEDRWGPPYAAVCARAAALASTLILEIAHSRATRTAEAALAPTAGGSMPRPQREARPTRFDAGTAKAETRWPDHEIVIANAGGRTVSEVVKALRRDPPPVDDSKERSRLGLDRLLFVAGNAAYLPRVFDQSANYLSVSMAEIFGSQHLALPTIKPHGFSEDYQSYINRASLFICGVGAIKSGLSQRYFNERNWKLPKNAVGDIAFNMLDQDGNSVPLLATAKRFMDHINPAITLKRLEEIDRVLVVLDAEEPEDKLDISLAVLRKSYASDVVVGYRLAKLIRDHF